MSDKRLKEMNRSLKVKSITDKLHSSGVVLDKVIDKLNRGSIAKRKTGLNKGVRAGYKPGGPVPKIGRPKNPRDKWKDKIRDWGTGRTFKPRENLIEKMGGSEKAKPHSTREGRVASGKRRIRRILKDANQRRPGRPLPRPSPGWKRPENIMIPLRAKHGVGSIVKGAKKIIGKTKPKPKEVNVDKLLKNLGDEIKAAPLPPQLKKLGPKLKKAFPHHDSAGKLKKAKGGRAGFQHGGRTNLYEELGRVEAEPSNRNRRAEVSRIHGELNKGYKKGGRSGYGSGGVVLKGKKVGIQIK